MRGGELGQLAKAVERMRTELEGKAYVERYVHTRDPLTEKPAGRHPRRRRTARR